MPDEVAKLYAEKRADGWFVEMLPIGKWTPALIDQVMVVMRHQMYEDLSVARRVAKQEKPNG